jgi:uncharacterized protein (DUF4415 family)
VATAPTARIGFRSHAPRALGKPLTPCRLAAKYATTEVEPKKTGRPKTHVGFRIDADLVDRIKASGPGYNLRVEAALMTAFPPPRATSPRGPKGRFLAR